ncbi:MAG: formate dehydrogenase, partial [Herminiimonas sp.]|nr:formate dehydrogenase [Herminiimonas sp.]
MTAVKTVTIFVPRDSTAIALGANETAAAIAREAKARGIAIKLVRNGSRGMFWLEPLVEVATDAGRIAFGPIEEHEVAALFDANFTAGGKHAKSLGLT